MIKKSRGGKNIRQLGAIIGAVLWKHLYSLILQEI